MGICSAPALCSGAAYADMVANALKSSMAMAMAFTILCAFMRISSVTEYTYYLGTCRADGAPPSETSFAGVAAVRAFHIPGPPPGRDTYGSEAGAGSMAPPGGAGACTPRRQEALSRGPGGWKGL